MTLPSSKSSSTTSSRTANSNPGRPLNPNSRSSEITNPMRRSFGGNPFTKPSIVANPRGFNPVTLANSSSEFPRRESISCLREHEEKENVKEPNTEARQTRLRSPSISKGAKNFMSPTISAASKFNPSPRKKILSERNGDPIRSSSTSLSDVRSSCSSVNITEDSVQTNQKMTLEASHDSGVTGSKVGLEDLSLGSKGLRKKVVFDSVVCEIPIVESTTMRNEDDLVNIDEEFMNPKLPCSSPLAPLDADPLVPLQPYDPEKNYLSPRPQFLHYRPSPRIESCVGEEENMSLNPLKDGFDLDGLSDTDVITDETSQSEKELDDATSNETTKEEGGSKSELDDVEISEEEAAELEEAVETKDLPKRRSFFTRSVFIISVFIALVACSAMIGTHYAPIRSYIATKGPGFTAETQKLMDDAAGNMRIWYVKSLFYISSWVSDISGKEYEWDELRFYNLTDLDDNPWLRKNDMSESLIHANGFENREIGSEEELKQIEYSETEQEVVAENADGGGDESPWGEPEERKEDGIMKEALNTEPEILNAKMEQEAETDAEMKVEKEFASDMHEAPKTAETEFQEPEISEVEMKNQTLLLWVEVEDGVYDLKEEQQGNIELDDHNTESLNFFNSSGITSLVGALVASVTIVASLVYARKRATFATVPAVEEIQAHKHLTAEKFDISPVAANRVAVQFDMIGVDSCPSEMSSFQKNSVSSRSRGTISGLRQTEEARSSERKTNTSGKSLRRESTASSSFSDLSLGTSSASYGSFTTYEMITNKHRNGDEEPVITPIRRSSRLRKQFVSP